MAALSSATAQDNAEGSILELYQASVEDGIVSLQAPGDDPIEYEVVDESTEDHVFITLVRLDEDEEEILFSYDQEIDEVAVTAENTELQVQIIDEEEIVAIDEAGECPWEDYECIHDAVNERLVDFYDDDLVAILAAVRVRFHDMEDAQHVGTVMGMVAQTLAESE